MAIYDSIRTYYARKRHGWHERRADLFVELMRPSPGSKVLDLGGGTGEFMSRVRARCDVSVTVADINAEALACAAGAGFATVQLVEGEPLPFGDGHFDIVFCNSVIEHVTLPKAECASRRIPNREWTRRSFAAQRAFADELCRVGLRYFVQTPHRSFPIESHTWLPFVGWLPHDITVNVVRVSDKVWAKRCGYVDWNLLGADDMRMLFRGSSIHVERVLGMPKSLIVYSAQPRARPPVVAHSAPP